MLYTPEMEKYRTKNGNYRIDSQTLYLKICNNCNEKCLCQRKDRKRSFCSHKCKITGNNNPNFNKQMSDIVKDKMKKSLSIRMNGNNNPFYGKTHSKETKELLSNLKKGKPGHKHTEETKERLSKLLSGKNNPMFGRCNDLNPNWKGGISREPYCIIWTKDIKEHIKNLDNHKCMNPYCRKITYKLCVHHIDYNKKNCDTNNLITLCISCNSIANYNRDYWQSLYESITILR